MTEFDQIRNAIICFEEVHHDKDKVIDDITNICFARKSKRVDNSRSYEDLLEDDWDSK